MQYGEITILYWTVQSSSVQCTVYSVQCSNVQCIVCSVQCTVKKCTVYSAVMYSVQSCIVQCTVYSVQCILYITVSSRAVYGEMTGPSVRGWRWRIASRRESPPKGSCQGGNVFVGKVMNRIGWVLLIVIYFVPFKSRVYKTKQKIGFEKVPLTQKLLGVRSKFKAKFNLIFLSKL